LAFFVDGHRRGGHHETTTGPERARGVETSRDRGPAERSHAMRRSSLVVLALLVLLPALWAGDDKQKKDQPAKPATPAEQFEALNKEFQQAQQDWQKEYLAAKTAGERQELLKKRPSPDPFASQMMELAEKNANEAVAFDALAWVVRTGPGTKDAPKALELLLKNHAENPRIARVCQGLSSGQVVDADKLLRAVLEKNADHEAKGMACYVLAVRLQRRATANATEEPTKEAKQLFDRVGADFLDVDTIRTMILAPNAQVPVAVIRQALAKTTDRQAKGQGFYRLATRLKTEAERADDPDRDKLNKEVEELLEQIGKDYADLQDRGRPLGDLAKADLEEIRLLGIGKSAPEIDGEDVDGKKLKLSDYRGKVILLDFWGDW
jgi:hypothetical protein